MRLVALLACWFAWGCVDPASGGGDEEDPVATDTGSVARADSWPAPPATYGADDVAVEMASALSEGLVDPWGLAGAWFELFEHADAGCPAGNATYLPVNYGGCSTPEGWHFAGAASFDRFAGAEGVGFNLSQDVDVIEPDGTRYHGTGNWGFSTPSGNGTYSVKATGMYGWPSADGMLGEGYATWLFLGGELAETGGTLAVDGALEIGGASLSFEGVEADTEACPGGTGTIGLRDPSGGWHRLVLDSACDGCGALSYDGTETGTTCVALAPVWATTLAALRTDELPWL